MATQPAYIEIRGKSDSREIDGTDFVRGDFFSHSSTAPAAHTLNLATIQGVQAVATFLGRKPHINSTVRFKGGDSYTGEGSPHSSPHNNAIDIGGMTPNELDSLRKALITDSPLFRKLMAIGIKGIGLYSWGVYLDAQPRKSYNTQSNVVGSVPGYAYAYWNKIPSFNASYVSSLLMRTDLTESLEDERPVTQKNAERGVFVLFWLLVPSALIAAFFIFKKSAKLLNK